MNKKICFRSALAGMLIATALVSSLSFAQPQEGDNTEGTASLSGNSVTLLPNGQTLITGGQDRNGKIQSFLYTEDHVSGGAAARLGLTLQFARAGHTATVLPDGTVLILGGIGADGRVVSGAELFDPASQRIEKPSHAPTPRAFHTATLLTDGRVLIAGGLFADGRTAKTIELWDPRGKNSVILSLQTTIDRRNHKASLLPDGRVLLSDGVDANGNALTESQVFDPQAQTVSSASNSGSLEESSGSMTEMRASSPEDEAENVPLDSLISIRFSRPAQMKSINSDTATLQGPEGLVSARVVAAEHGMLAFITPAAPLATGSTYIVKLTGAVDASNQNVAYAEFSFRTIDQSIPTSGDEEWSPTADWQTNRPPSKYESLPDLHGPPGKTALAGQVLKLNGEPLVHVTLEIGTRRTESDSTGRFLLTDIPPGHQVLVIEGESANSAGKKYGRFEFGDEIKSGTTNRLDFKIWMPVLDMAHEITIPSPTIRETILTTPTMPGLELHLPAGTVITDAKGKVVTKITITPVPLDRPPFPLPFVQVPIYFTIQPGGAYIAVNGRGPKGARLFYPNSYHEPAGVPFAFWNYNADHNGWYVYGQGMVSKDRTQVIPASGVVIYEFSGAMVGGTGGGPNSQNPGGNHSKDGEPVTLSSGLFVYNKTDLVLPDVIPLSLTRTYRPNDSWARPFGIGTTHPYEIFIGGNGQAFTATPWVDLILPDGTRIHFIGVGSGGSYTTYLNSSAGTEWYGAVITDTQMSANPNGYSLPGAWQLQTKDGTFYSFPEALGLVNPGCQGLVGITDRHGNQVKITRNNDTNCTIAQITSPSGRYIQFQYDSSFRVKVATDNIGRQVLYNYDASGRLQTVTDANSGVWTYGYDSLNRMTTIQDPRLITYLTNTYDSGGRVYRQYLADGISYYQFNWTTTSNNTNTLFTTNTSGPPPYSVTSFRGCNTCNEGFAPLITQVDVVDPRGYTRRVAFNQNGYTSSDTHAFGMPEAETTTFTYYADNLVSSMTDQLGRVTTYGYDINGNLISLTHLSGTPNAVTTTMSYDGTFSQLLSVTDPLNNTTSLAYDTFGNATTLTDPLGHQITFGYNGLGLVTSVTDAMSNTTRFAYDFADLIGITDPLQNTTSMFHDSVGRLVQRTDPLGHTTKYQFNNLNEITQITDPLQGTTSFTYDANENLQTVQDARQQGTNNKTVYAYDNFDRVQTRTDPLLRQESYGYDILDNLTTFTDRRGKIATFQYDGLNRRKFAGYGTLPGPTYESTINYTYDGGNRLSSVVDSASGTITPVFDGLNRLTSETTPQGSVSYGYDNGGRRTSATVAGQPSVCYTYDNGNRLTGVGQGTCPVITNTTSFTYDSANRRSTMTLSNGIVLTYGFDNNSRVNSMSYQLGTTAIGSLSYIYDAAGRRIQVGGSLAATGFPQVVTAATYDAANELTNWNGTMISYDQNGNIQSDGATSYTWNARNQLSAHGGTSFQYDAYGRRTLNAAGNNLLYEGWNAGQELSGTTAVANRILGGVDEFFNRADSTGTYSPITDALGSVLALTNLSGNITTQYSYDPFGNTSAGGSASTNTSQYAGRDNDINGLYHNRARYYNPQLGRFISEDPLEFAGGVNLYQYAADNPMIYKDPFGYGPGDNWYGHNNPDFQNWFHRNWKLPGDPDATQEEMQEAYQAWEEQGSPTRDPKGDRRNKCDQPEGQPEPESEPEPEPDAESPISEMINWAESHPLAVGAGIIVVGGAVIIVTGGAAVPVLAAAF